MLAFYLNNEPFAISEDNAIRLTWRNPACNLENFPGDVGLGIDIPANEINRTLLGNPETFDRYSKENTREFEGFEIRYAGVRLMRGTYIIETADEEQYSGWLRSDAGNLGEKYRERYIYDSISFYEEKTFENKADYDPLTDPYGCPQVYNPDFLKEKGEKFIPQRYIENPRYGKLYVDWWYTVPVVKEDTREYIWGDGEETEDFTEAFYQNSGYMVNDKNGDGTVRTPETQAHATSDKVVEELDVAVVSPMLFLNYLLKTLFKDAGFAIDESFLLDDPDLQKLVVYHNFDITEFTFIPSLWGWLSYNRQKDYWYDVAIGQGVEIVKRDVNGKFVFKNLLPKIKLKEFLIGVQNMLNVFIHFRPGRKIIDIIDRESIFAENPKDISKYLVESWSIDEKKDSTIKFLFEHDKDDMIFQEGWEDIEDYRDKQKEAVDTRDDLENIENPEMDEIRYVRETNTYVQYKLWEKEWTDDEGENHQKKFIGWDHLSIAFQNGYINYGQEEEEEVKTNFSTLSVNEIPADDSRKFPFVKQKGNIRSDMFAYENFSPRLLFYTGNNEGSNETANITLDWEKAETGLMESRWKYWSRFWATRQPVETKGHFPLGMLDYIINNIYKKFRAKEGEFIIEELSTEFRTNQVGMTEIKGYKINYSPKIYSLNDVWSTEDVIWIDETFDMHSTFDTFEPLNL